VLPGSFKTLSARPTAATKACLSLSASPLVFLPETSRALRWRTVLLSLYYLSFLSVMLHDPIYACLPGCACLSVQNIKSLVLLDMNIRHLSLLHITSRCTRLSYLQARSVLLLTKSTNWEVEALPIIPQCFPRLKGNHTKSASNGNTGGKHSHIYTQQSR
jgi:hypothetical protein